MKKSTQQLIIIFFTTIFLLIAVYFIWSQTIGKKKLVIPPKMSQTEIENDPYLSMAKRILDQIDSQTDSRGFYGYIQDCEKNEQLAHYDCSIRLLDYQGKYHDGTIIENPTLYASHRQTLAVIWARYRYYAKTGDQKQLQKMKKDVDNMIDKVIDDPDWILQTKRFNCVLMEEIYNSPLIELKYKERVKYICNQAYFEAHPQSTIFKSQNKHVPVKIWNNYPLTDAEKPFETMVELDLQRPKVDYEYIYYNKDELIKHIYEDFLAFYKNGLVDENEKILTTDEKKRFIVRELSAAIDRFSSYKINQNASVSKAETDLIDYLLLTQETLNWYISSPNSYGKTTSCLINQNMNIFFNHFQLKSSLSNDQNNFLNNFGLKSDDDLLPYCLIFTSNNIIDKKLLIDQINNLNSFAGANDWHNGYLINASYEEKNFKSTNYKEYEFNIEENALFAGVLSQ